MSPKLHQINLSKSDDLKSSQVATFVEKKKYKFWADVKTNCSYHNYADWRENKDSRKISPN